MLDQPDLKLHGIAYVDGGEVLCPECGGGHCLELRKRGMREVWPAFLSCLACGSGEDSRIITNGLVDAVLAARTGRKTAGDRDTFTAEWRGIVMTGELVPEFVVEDALSMVRAVRDEVRKDTTKWWRGKKKEAKARTKAVADTAKSAGKKAAKDAGHTAKAAALSTAWNLQTGGAGPAAMPKPKRSRCTVKGCRAGTVTLSTRLHSPSGKAREVKIPCGVCHRART
ncbi:hypothetical protein [Streptomyces sp. NPDC053720]|uniref:hypothetical protein n=1 Tax=Streptomyces sp. NPDC053720 TaxID=3154855 RepID=UPI003432B429